MTGHHQNTERLPATPQGEPTEQRRRHSLGGGGAPPSAVPDGRRHQQQQQRAPVALRDMTIHVTHQRQRRATSVEPTRTRTRSSTTTATTTRPPSAASSSASLCSSLVQSFDGLPDYGEQTVRVKARRGSAGGTASAGGGGADRASAASGGGGGSGSGSGSGGEDQPATAAEGRSASTAPASCVGRRLARRHSASAHLLPTRPPPIAAISSSSISAKPSSRRHRIHSGSAAVAGADDSNGSRSDKAETAMPPSSSSSSSAARGFQGMFVVQRGGGGGDAGGTARSDGAGGRPGSDQPGDGRRNVPKRRHSASKLYDNDFLDDIMEGEEEAVQQQQPVKVEPRRRHSAGRLNVADFFDLDDDDDDDEGEGEIKAPITTPLQAGPPKSITVHRRHSADFLDDDDDDEGEMRRATTTGRPRPRRQHSTSRLKVSKQDRLESIENDMILSMAEIHPPTTISVGGAKSPYEKYLSGCEMVARRPSLGTENTAQSRQSGAPINRGMIRRHSINDLRA